MAHLTLVGASDDGTRLLLVTDDGTEHTLTVDAKLRAALRGQHARLGELEITMDSALRPRDIQTRIRSGESPESVAAAASTTVDKIMAFAAPVLAERQHVADRAQRSSVRRTGTGVPGAARTLGESVTAHLRAHNVSADAVEWDSWRREDGRWTVSGTFAAGSRTGTATFAFDAPGNYVVAEDDDALWLLGEGPSAPARERSSPAPRARRLTAVPNEELPLGDDAIEMVSADTEEPAAEEPAAEEPTAESTTEAATESTAEVPVVEQPGDDQADPAQDEPSAEAPRRTNRRRGSRASVPSWDEIMFGSSDSKGD